MYVFHDEHDKPPSTQTQLGASLIAGFTATACSLPFDLLKSRMRKLFFEFYLNIISICNQYILGFILIAATLYSICVAVDPLAVSTIYVSLQYKYTIYHYRGWWTV